MPAANAERRKFSYSVSRTWETSSLWSIGTAFVLALFFAIRGKGMPGGNTSPEAVRFILGAVMILGVIWGGIRVFSVWRRSGDPRFVEVTTESALLPRAGRRTGFFKVKFVEIRSIDLEESEKDERAVMTMSVDTAQGESRLLSSGFANARDFTDFSGLLIARWKEDRAKRRGEATAQRKPAAAADPAAASLIAAIAEKEKTDPYIGAKIAGKEILTRLLNAMKNERGVHSESLLCSLGALAGYACQVSVRSKALLAGMSADALFVVAGTKDGNHFYLGDALVAKLATDKLSVYSLAAGAAQQAGATTLPDLKEMFERSAATLGTEQFGVPKRIEGHAAGDLPINYLRALWPGLLPVVKDLARDPVLWPMAYAMAIQEAIALTSQSLPPQLGLTIVMEAAIPMSKVKL